jgi:tetratricopeptide (TPR) repeat protein
MTSNMPTTGSEKSKNQFDIVRLLLSSQRPSDIWRGLDLVRQWLNEDKEDRDVYGLLLDVVDKNHEIREQVRDLLIDMMKRESKQAANTLSRLSSTASAAADLLADAEDAFYAAEYERAIQLYRQVLTREPENARAKSHLTEAMKETHAANKNPELPRDAIQYYRRAHSYIAAKDFSTAMKMLGAAVESAQTRGLKYPEAESLLESVQDSSIAEEIKKKIYELAIDKNSWDDALEVCDSTLSDLTDVGIKDPGIKNEFSSIHKLLDAELRFQKKGIFRVIARLDQLRKSYKSAHLNPKDPLIKYIGSQLRLFTTVRSVGLFSVAVIIFFVINPWKILPQRPAETVSPTITVTQNIIPSNTATVNISSTPAPTLTPSETPVLDTPTSTLTPTDTPIPTPTLIGYGKITAYIFAVETPNGKRINHSLKPGMVIPLLEKSDAIGGPWYRTTWVDSGTTYEGWILAQNIQIVPGP